MSKKPDIKSPTEGGPGSGAVSAPESEGPEKVLRPSRKKSGAQSASDTEGPTTPGDGIPGTKPKRSRPRRSGIPEATTSPDKFPRPPRGSSRIARSSQFINPASPDKMAYIPERSKSAEQAARDSSTWPRKTKIRQPSLISPDTFNQSREVHTRHSTSRSPRPPRSSRSGHESPSTSGPDTSNVKLLMEEMRQHILQLKQELEQEKCFAKALKREKTLEIKSVKETEQQRAVLSINELRSRYYQEKQKDLAHLRESLNKRHEDEIQKIVRQKEDQIQKSQGELQKEHGSIMQRAKHQALHEARDEARKSFDNEKAKLYGELDELKMQKRRLEDEVHTLGKSDRTKANDLKRLVGEHQRAMDKIRKDARRDIVRLLDEVRAKERLISDLGKEVGHAGHIAARIQVERDSLDALLKLAESWEKKPGTQGSSTIKTSESPVTESFDFGIPEGVDNSERDKIMQQKMTEMSTAIKRLEEINKNLNKDNSHLEKKLKMFLSIKGMAPLVEKNKQLNKRVRALEQSKRKLEERNRVLGEDNSRLRSAKEEMRSRLDREESAPRRSRPKHRRKDKDRSKDKSKDKSKEKSKERERETESEKERDDQEKKEKREKSRDKNKAEKKEKSKKDGDDGFGDKEKEELVKLRKENQEQFNEIVELKQAALILELKQSAMEIAQKQRRDRGDRSGDITTPSPRDTPSDRRARSLSAQRRHMRTPTSGFSESGEDDSQRSHSSSGIPVPSKMRSRSSNGRHSFHGSHKTPLQGKEMGPWSATEDTSLKSNGDSSGTGNTSDYMRPSHRRSHSGHRNRLLARVNCQEDASLRSKSTGASIDVSWAGSWASSALSDSDDIGWEEFDKAALEANLSQVSRDYRELKKTYEHLLSLIDAAVNGHPTKTTKDQNPDPLQNGQTLDFDKLHKMTSQKDTFQHAIAQIKNIQKQSKELQENNSKLKLALQDAREQNELLEFRTLELEEDDDNKPKPPPKIMETELQEAHFNDLKEKMADLKDSKAGMLLTQTEIQLILQAIDVLVQAREKIHKMEIREAGLRNQIQLVESERDKVSIEKRKLGMQLAVQSSGIQRTDAPCELAGIMDETMQLTPTSQEIEGGGGEGRKRGDDNHDTMQLLTPVSMLLDRTTSGSEEGDSPPAKTRRKPSWEKEGDKKQLRDQKELRLHRLHRNPPRLVCGLRRRVNQLNQLHYLFSLKGSQIRSLQREGGQLRQELLRHKMCAQHLELTMQCKIKDSTKSEAALRARIEELEGQLLDLEATIHQNEARSHRHKDELQYKIATLEKQNYLLEQQLQLSPDDDEDDSSRKTNSQFNFEGNHSKIATLEEHYNELQQKLELAEKEIRKLNEDLEEKEEALSELKNNNRRKLAQEKKLQKEEEPEKELSLLDDLELTSDEDDEGDNTDSDFSLDLPDDSKEPPALPSLPPPLERTDSNLTTTDSVLSEKIQELEQSVEQLQESEQSLKDDLAGLTVENTDLKSKQSAAENKIKDLESTKDVMTRVISDQVAETGKVSAESEKQHRQKIADLQMSESTMKSVIADLQTSEGQLKERLSALLQEIEDLKGKCETNVPKEDPGESQGISKDEEKDNRIKELEDLKDDLQAKLDESNAQRQRLEEEKADLRTKLDESNAQMQELDNQKADLQTKLEESNAQTQELEEQKADLQTKLEESNAQMQELERLNTDLQTKVDQSNTQIQDLEEMKANLQTKLDESNAQTQQLEEQKADLQGKLDECNTQIPEVNTDLQTKLDKSNAQTQELKEQKADLQTELEGSNAQMQELEKLNTDLQTKLDQSNTQIQDLAEMKANLQTKLDERNAQTQQLEEQKADLQGKLDECNTQLPELNADLEKKLDKSNAQTQELEEQKADLQTKLDESNAQMQELEELNTDLQTKFDESSTQTHQLEDQISALMAKLDETNAQVQEIEEQKADLQTKLDESNTQIPDFEDQKADLQTKLDESNTQTQELEKQKTDLQETFDESNAQMQEFEKSCQQNQEDISQLLAAKESLELDIEAEKKQVKELENELSKIKDELSAESKSEDTRQQYQEELQRRDNQINKLEDIETKLKEDLQAKESEASQLEENNTTLKQELESMQEQVAKLTEIEKDLQCQIASLQEEVNQSKINNDKLENNEKLITDANSRQRQLEEQLSELNEKLQDSQARNEVLEKEVSNLEERKQTLSDEVARSQQREMELQKAADGSGVLLEQVEELKEKDEVKTEELEQLRQQNENMEKQMAQLLEENEQKEELENEVAQLKEELVQQKQDMGNTSTVVEELELEKGDLEKLVTEKYDAVKQLQEQVEDLKKKEIEEMEKQTKEFGEKIRDLETQNEQLQNQVEQLQQESEETVQLSETFKKEKEELGNRLQQLREEDSKLEIDNINNSRLVEELKGEKDKVAELEHQIRDITEKVEKELQQEVKKAKNENSNSDHKNEIQNLQEELQGCQKDAALYKEKWEEEMNEKDQLKAKVDKLQSDIAALQQKNDDLSVSIDSLQEEKAHLESQLNEVQDLLKESDFEGEDALRDHITDLEQSERALKLKVKRLESAEADEKDAYDQVDAEAKAAMKSYEEKLSELQQTEAVLSEKVAQLEISESHWKQEAEALEERVRELEEIRHELKGRVSRAEEEIEELQVKGLSTQPSMADDELSLLRELDTQPIPEESDSEIESIPDDVGDDDEDDINEMELLKQEVAVLQESEEVMKEELAEKQREVEELKKLRDEEVDHLKNTNGDLEKSKVELMETVGKLEVNLKENVEQIDGLEKQIANLQGQELKLKDIIQDLKSERDTLQFEVDESDSQQEEIGTLKQQVEDLKASQTSPQRTGVKKTNRPHSADQTKLSQLERQLTEKSSALDDKIKKSQKLQAKVNALEMTLADTMSKNLDQEEKCHKLQDALDQLENSEFELMEKVATLEIDSDSGDDTDKDEVSFDEANKVPVFIRVTPPSPRGEDGPELVEELQKRIQEMEEQEEAYKQQICDLEERQLAFQETLAQADSIMKDRETNLHEKIDALETSQSDMKEELRKARESESSLKMTGADSMEDVSEYTSVFEDTEDFMDKLASDKEEKSRSEKSPDGMSTMTPDDKDMQIQALQYNIAKLEDNEHEINTELAESKDLVETLQDLNEELEQQVTEMKATIVVLERNQSDNEASTEKTNESGDLQAKLSELESVQHDYAELVAQHSDLQSKHTNLTKSNRDLQIEVDDLYDQIQQQENSLTRAKQQNSILQANLKPNQKPKKVVLNHDGNETSPLHLKHLVSDLETELQEVQENIDSKVEEEIKQSEEKFKAEIIELKGELDALEDVKKTLEDKIKKQDDMIRILQSKQDSAGLRTMSSNGELEDTIHKLEASIEFLTEKLQDSEDRETSLTSKLDAIREQSEKAVKDTTSMMEKRIKDLAASEEQLKSRAQELEITNADLEEELSHFQTAQSKSENQSTDLESANKELQKQCRSVEDSAKTLRLDNSQLKHEKDLLNEKLSALESSEGALQQRLEEIEENESKLRIQLKEAGAKEKGLKEQVQKLQDSVNNIQNKNPAVKMEKENRVLQDELQKACQKMEALKEDKDMTEDKLKKIEESLQRDRMVTIPQLEYQELKAQAKLLDMTEDPTEQSIVKLQVQLVQTTEELKQLKGEKNEKDKAHRDLMDKFNHLKNNTSSDKDNAKPVRSQSEGDNAYPVFEIPADCLTAAIDLEGSSVTLEELLYSLESSDFATFHVTPDIDDLDMHHIQEDKNFFVHLGPRQRKPGAARKRVIQQLVKNLPEVKKKKRSIFPGKPKPQKPARKPQALVDEAPTERHSTNEIQSGRPTDPDERKRLLDDLVDNIPEVNCELPDYESLYAQLPKTDFFARKPVKEDRIDKAAVTPPQSSIEDSFDSRPSSVEPPGLPWTLPPSRPVTRNSSFSDDSLSVISDAGPPPLPSAPPPSFLNVRLRPVSRTESFESDELNRPSWKSSKQDPESDTEVEPERKQAPVPDIPSTTPLNSGHIQSEEPHSSYITHSPKHSADIKALPPFNPSTQAADDPIFPNQANLHHEANQNQELPSFIHPQAAQQLQRPPSFDSGMDTISSTATDSTNSPPGQPLQLPQIPVRKSAPPPPLPKPETPLWLKKMMDWQHMEKEKELSELKKLQVRLMQLENQNEEKERLIRELQQSEQEARRKLWHGEEARRLQNKLQVKELEVEDKERTIARQTSAVKEKEREIARLEARLISLREGLDSTSKQEVILHKIQQELEKSQGKLSEKENKLKELDEQGAKVKGQLSQKDRELMSKMEEIRRQSAQVDSLQAELDKLRGNDDSKAGQLMELAAKVDVISKENEELREKTKEVTNLEQHCSKLQSQVADSRMSEQEKRSLQSKLQLAETMLRQKTAQELRLSEDVAILQDRVRQMDDQNRDRDGIEEDYRKIKEQFDEMEHQKHEAELAVAPLKAKVSYLTEKCKEKDATLQVIAMDMHKSNPTKADKLLSEISALQSPLPQESTNQPLATERRVRRHRKGGNRSNRTILDPVREEESIYSDTGQNESANPRRGQRSRRSGSRVPASSILDDLDIAGDIDLGGDLDLGEISVKDLIDQTSRASGRHSIRYFSDDDEEDGDLLSSLGNPSPLTRTSSNRGGTSGLGSFHDFENGGDPTSASQLARQPRSPSPRRRKQKVPHTMPTLHGSPEEILQLHQDLENSHTPNYDLPISEMLADNLNLNNLHLQDLPNHGIPAANTAQQPLLSDLGRQQPTHKTANQTHTQNANLFQPSHPRTLNNSQLPLSNGLMLPTTEGVRTTTGIPAYNGINSIPNGTAPLTQYARMPISNYGIPSSGAITHTVPSSLGTYSNNHNLLSSPAQDFAIPRPELFQNMSRPQSGSRDNLNTHANPHSGLVNGYQPSMNTNGIATSLMTVPSIGVTPSVAPSNLNGSAGVDSPDYIGRQNLPQSTTGHPDAPQNLTISKVIGSHGMLLTWKPPPINAMGKNRGTEIAGYKIYVDGKQKQFVTNAHLSKAVIDGINTRSIRRIGIQSVSVTGQTSVMTIANFDENSVLSSSLSGESVPEASTEASSVVSEEPQERLFMAVYAYKPSQHSPNDYPTYELSFEEGDIIRVCGQMRADGFYHGKVHGKKGLVPSNFIEEIFMSSSMLKKKKHGKSSKNHSGDRHSSHSNKDRHHRESKSKSKDSKNSRTYSKKHNTNRDNRSRQRDVSSKV